MNKLESTSAVSVTFHGDGDVRHAIKTNPMLYQSVWDLCSAHLDAIIRVDTASRFTDAEPVEWAMRVAFPGGCKTVLLTQRTPAGKVSVTPA